MSFTSRGHVGNTIHFSPTIKFCISIVFFIFIFIAANDFASETIQSINQLKVSNQSENSTKGFFSSSLNDMPLYGDSKSFQKLENDIDERIFAVKRSETTEKVKKPVTVKSKVYDDWNILSKNTLSIDGVSFLNKSAYINKKRYVVGESIVDFPIKGVAEERVAILKEVYRDSVLIIVGSDSFIIDIKKRVFQ